ncbi:MAG: serine/threonine-protein kinase [Anaeromyxobacter sp.]
MTVDEFSQIALGSVLAGKYRITREIGRGGMAAVYEAENLGLGKRVAVKVLAAELTTSRVVRERFLREARASAAVRSPYICDVYDVGEFDNRPFLVMELLEGESLYDRMTRVRRLDIPITLKIMTQTAKGLAKAHSAGIVHRDLKPENLFLTRNEEGEIITKLLDFGLAKFYATSDGPAQARLTREGALFGTPAYMSPEQAKGRGEVDHRSDLWALGCITYECLTGHTVWNVDQGVAMILAQVANAQIPLPSKLRPDLPPAFDKWLLKALQRSPEDRFQTAAQFMIALTEALSPGESSHIQTPSLLVDVDDMLQRAAERKIGEDDSVETSVPDRFDERTSVPSSRRPPLQKAVEAPRLNTPEHAKSPKVIESAPPKFRSRRGPILLAAAAVLLVAAGAAFVFRDSVADLFGTSSAAHGSQTPSAPSLVGQSAPLETQGFGETITEAQGALVEGKIDEAIRLFDDAIKNGGEGIATNLRTHVKAAQETTNGPCHLLALGRPRPFTVSDPPSRPTIVASGSHAVVGWVDGHEDKTRRQVYTTVLDEGLRRITVPQLATPESLNARYPQFWTLDVKANPSATGIALLFWDATSRQAGIFARKLDVAGRIQGGMKNVAPLSKDEYAPAIARTSDGSYWVAWEDDGSDGAQNLLLRHLTADFDPTGPVISLTALKPDRALRPSAVRPAVSVSNGKLRVLFTLRQGQQRRVYSLVLDESSDLVRTVTAPKISTNTASLDHRFLAPIEALGREGTASDDARTHCLGDTCFLLWGEEAAGLVAMAIDARSNAVLYRHEIAPRGARPAIAANEKQLLAAFYEASRLRVALFDRTGVGAVATIGKVSGIQPLPDVSATPRPDRWLVAWRDYEAGHFEAMAATISCQPAAAPR